MKRSPFPEVNMDKIQYLQALQDGWAHCQGCALHASRHQIVFGYGNPNAQVMIIGEAPGENEDMTGLPFVGQAGLLLDQLLGNVSARDDVVYELNQLNSTKGVSAASEGTRNEHRIRLRELLLEDYYITNVVMCFPEGSLVRAKGVERVYRRFYEGTLIEVRMSDGNKLTGTPNHPVLTTRGWIPLSLLQEGDHVVRCDFGEEVSSGNPNVENTPTPIEKIFASFSKSGNSSRVVGREVDFHGDGMKSDVDIVTIDRELEIGLKVSLAQQFGKSMLSGGGQNSRLVNRTSSGDSSFLERSLGVQETRSERNGSGGLGHLASFSMRQSGISNRHRLAPITNRHPGFQEKTAYGTLASYMPGSYGLDTLSEQVVLDNPRDNSPSPLGPRGNGRFLRAKSYSSSDEIASHSLIADPAPGRDLLHRLPGKVELVRVTGVEEKEFRGHVYNLQTTEGWYTAERVVVSNCRPPENRDPTPKEIAACSTRLREQIYAIDPVLIITTGKFASTAVVGKKLSITNVRGQLYDVEFQGRVSTYRYPVMVILHPSYLLRINDFNTKGGESAKTYNSLLSAMALVDQYNFYHYGIPVPKRPEPEQS